MDREQERELIAHIQHGTDVQRRRAWECLFRTYNQLVLGFLFKRGMSQADAQDLSQRAWLKAIECFATFDPNRNFRVWLIVIARNLFVDEYRRNKRQDALHLEHKEGMETFIPQDDGHLDFARLRDWILAVKAGNNVDCFNLPKRRCSCFDLPYRRRIFLEGMCLEVSIEELAEKIGITEDSCKSIKKRLRADLKICLGHSYSGKGNEK